MSDEEIELRYRPEGGVFSYVVCVVLIGGSAIGMVYGAETLLRTALSQEIPDYSVLNLSVLVCLTLAYLGTGTGVVCVAFAVLGWRSLRRNWWLRTSSRGLQINDRVIAPPRRYAWSEIEEFTLEDSGNVRVQFFGQVKLAATITGNWDRTPADAVDLMNERLQRFRTSP